MVADLGSAYVVMHADAAACSLLYGLRGDHCTLYCFPAHGVLLTLRLSAELQMH